MQPIVIKPRGSIKLVIGPVEYILKKPSLDQYEVMQERVFESQQSGRGQIKVVKEYLIAAGLPEDVVGELDVDQMGQIVEALAPVKKN